MASALPTTTLLGSCLLGQLASAAVSVGSAALRGVIQQRIKATACAAATGTMAGTVCCSAEALSGEVISSSWTGSACSPPRTTRRVRCAVAPAHCIAPSKTRRRRQPPGGGNGDTGDSDEDGGAPPPPGGGGGDDFWGDGAGDGDSSSSGNAPMLWRLLCIASMLQVVHFMLLGHRPAGQQRHAAFAALACAFYHKPHKHVAVVAPL